MLSPERHRHHRHPSPPQPPPPPHHPPQPSHVVATIENLPAEGGSGGGRSGISAPSSSVRQRIRKVLNRRPVLANPTFLLLGHPKVCVGPEQDIREKMFSQGHQEKYEDVAKRSDTKAIDSPVQEW
ncbi:hypothetical protein DUI87_10608 [Hirundo rustica rustica]|uniref:Uncharacterized protein n=1 Tax=Hirundo rustica rustica TaxID=333673 RepID=A0A3M0L113_HIRRU|nr:hypothetical protein DUI87_10608 [Hirundo rustica rustica]